MKNLLSLLCAFCLFLVAVNGTPSFSICSSSVCLSQPVNYVCTVDTSGGANNLRWRILNSTGAQGGVATYDLNGAVGEVRTIATHFTTNLTASTGPIVSNISFTPVSSISNYTVECEVIGGNAVTCPILIEGIPPSVVPNVSFTSSTLDLSWLPSTSSCLSHYTISLTSISSTINITDTSLSFSVLTLNSTEYSISVAAVDRADRSMAPQTVSFIPDAPLSVTNLMLRRTDYPDNITNTSTVNFTVSWTAPPSSSRPPVLQYEVMHDVTDPDTTITVLAPSTLTITGATVGSVYTVQVLASNVLGTGMSTSATITISFTPPPPPVTTSVPPTITPTMSGTPTTSPRGGLPVGAIIGIVIAVIAIVAGIILIIVGIYLLCCVLKKGKGGSEAGSSGHWKKEVAPQQDDQPNYSQVEHSKKSSSSGSRQKPQEPQVQYSADSQQLQYAELSHASSKGSSIKPQPKGPQVQYSSVKPH